MTKALQPLRLFLCHASGDKERVRELYKRLRDDGYAPWLDEENLLGGKDWRREIAAEVKKSDIVLVCLSHASINKKGFVQKEIVWALDAAEEQREGSIFIIPLKLEECEMPERLSHLHGINLFESRGYEKLRASLKEKSGELEHPVEVEPASAPPASAAGESDGAHGTVRRDLLVGLLLIASVLTLKFAAERTAFGNQLKLKSDYLLHSWLAPDDPPVAIVDTRDLAPTRYNVEGQTVEATPREPLRQMIEAVAEANPKAIGFVIDFSPEDDKYIDPRDPDFFRFCLDVWQQRGVPVFLGIDRTLTAERPADWLGDEDYQWLAVNMRIPKDRSRMLDEINMGPPWFLKGKFKSRALGAALADAYERRSSAGISGLLEAVMEVFRRVGFIKDKFKRDLGLGLTLKEFRVDFSRLNSIEIVRTIEPVVLRYEKEKFKGKVVLIGNAAPDRERDSFEVPGLDGKYAGIFLHASAADTLITLPYWPTGKGRLVLDAFYALALVSAVVLIRHRLRRRAAYASGRSLGLFTLLAAVVLIIASVVFVRATHLMWDDFLAAPAMLLYNPSVGRRLANLRDGLRRRAAALFRSHP